MLHHLLLRVHKVTAAGVGKQGNEVSSGVTSGKQAP
jgi:hypothetical protein